MNWPLMYFIILDLNWICEEKGLQGWCPKLRQIKLLSKVKNECNFCDGPEQQRKYDIVLVF